jgi:hypothetical protein
MNCVHNKFVQNTNLQCYYKFMFSFSSKIHVPKFPFPERTPDVEII